MEKRKKSTSTVMKRSKIFQPKNLGDMKEKDHLDGAVLGPLLLLKTLQIIDYMHKKSVGWSRDKDKVAALKEVKLLQSLNHPCCVALQDVFLNYQQANTTASDDTHGGEEGEAHNSGRLLCLVMTYCESGDLARILKTAKRANQILKESQIVSWFVQIILGMHYLHNKKIIHRDIKPQNIFLTDSRKHVKIGDFGLAKELRSSDNMLRAEVGTPLYTSPEIVTNQRYSFPSDVWSAGCILYECLTLHPPFRGHTTMELVSAVCKSELEPVTESYSPETEALCRWMLKKNQTKRPTCAQILSLPALNRTCRHFISHYKPQNVAERVRRQQAKDMLAQLDTIEKSMESLKLEDFCTESSPTCDEGDEIIVPLSPVEEGRQAPDTTQTEPEEPVIGAAETPQALRQATSDEKRRRPMTRLNSDTSFISFSEMSMSFANTSGYFGGWGLAEGRDPLNETGGSLMSNAVGWDQFLSPIHVDSKERWKSDSRTESPGNALMDIGKVELTAELSFEESIPQPIITRCNSPALPTNAQIADQNNGGKESEGKSDCSEVPTGVLEVSAFSIDSSLENISKDGNLYISPNVDALSPMRSTESYPSLNYSNSADEEGEKCLHIPEGHINLGSSLEYSMSNSCLSPLVFEKHSQPESFGADRAAGFVSRKPVGQTISKVHGLKVEQISVSGLSARVNSVPSSTLWVANTDRLHHKHVLHSTRSMSVDKGACRCPQTDRNSPTLVQNTSNCCEDSNHLPRIHPAPVSKETEKPFSGKAERIRKEAEETLAETMIVSGFYDQNHTRKLNPTESMQRNGILVNGMAKPFSYPSTPIRTSSCERPHSGDGIDAKPARNFSRTPLPSLETPVKSR